MKIKPYIYLILLFFLLLTCKGVTAPDSEECLQLAREFLSLLINKEYSRAISMCNSIMKSSLPEDKLAQAWEKILEEVGEYENEIAHNESMESQFTTVVVTCGFTNIPMDMKVVFNPGKKITGLLFLPPYSAFDAYTDPDYVSAGLFTEQEVIFGEPGWKLPGTLSLPKQENPPPAIILVHGSGPQDRDETIGPNKPFKDIARGLASKGIAVFRYEKRTKQYPAKCAENIEDLTVYEETINDACTAVSFLRKRKDIRTDRIFILGHSLGGMLVPRIALQNPEPDACAGFIVLAGPTRPFEVILLAQTEYLAGIDGNITGEEKQNIEDLKKKVTRLKTGELSKLTPPGDLPLDIPAMYWLDLKGYLPHIIASEINRPFLILQGGRDYQVTREDFTGWEKALKGRENVKLIFYEDLNHLFITGKGPSIPSEYFEKGHVEKKVIDDIAFWIHEVSKK